MIKYKALFLLAIFLLHNAVGLTCALLSPQQLTKTLEVSAHDHTAQTHSHTENAPAAHSHAAPHEHEALPPSPPEQEAASNSEHSKVKKAEACCQDEVSEIADLAKIVPQKVHTPVSPLFFAAVLSYFYLANVFIIKTLSPRDKYFARSYHPPIPSIRIAIQSFLI